MSGASYILAINLTVAVFLAAAFLGVVLYDISRIGARWLSLGYLLGALNFVLEFVIAATGYGGILSVAAYAAFMAALVAFNAGLGRMYDMRIPWRVMTAIFVAALALRVGIDGMDRTSLLRMTLYQAPYAVMQGLGAWLVWRSGDRRILETLLVIVLGLTSLHYLAKPFVSLAAGGTGAGPESYLDTAYAMFSQSVGTVLAFALALLLLVVLVRNILSDITERSETDALSGLLNRRGFEQRRDTALAQKAMNGLPVALILADLDRFKCVNDTLGHSAGDRVIQAFGDLILASLQPHQAAGRVGGEEFAILLPGSNLAAARLLAESLRSSLALTEIPGLPPERRFTASFGVAELRNGESALAFEERADAALYAAKHAGRDRVESASASLVRAATGP